MSPARVKLLAEKKPKIHPRKMQIVRAAVLCFLEEGFHQTGMRDVAQRAGVSLGNLYNHFKGKEAILAFIAELEDAELDGFIDMLSQTDDPRGALGRFLDTYGRYAAQPENALLGVEVMSEALRNAQIEEVFARNRMRLTAALSDCLSAGISEGVFSAQIAPEAAALMILDALEGSGLRALAKPQNEAGLAALLMRAVLA